MKFILSIMVVLFLFGCNEKVKDGASNATISDTQLLQPKVADKALQPPTPPSISVE